MKSKINSMMYWYPKIQHLGIPMPETRIIPVKAHYSALIDWVEERINNPIIQEIEMIKFAAERFSYPVFLRTDHFSGKHNWKRTCFIENAITLERNIVHLIEESFCVAMMEGGLPIDAFCIRKYVPMDNLFIAFHGDMPVNPEIRCFIKDGKLLCYHWYWVEEAIKSGTLKEKLPKNWRQILKNAQRRCKTEVESTVLPAAKCVAKEFNGFWSVDFCRAKNGSWQLIDMALGHNSWHPEKCKYSKLSNLPM